MENEPRTSRADLDYIDGVIKKSEVAKKRITEAFKVEKITLPELRKDKTGLELSE